MIFFFFFIKLIISFFWLARSVVREPVVERGVAYSTREIEDLIYDARRDERDKSIAVTKTLEKKLAEKEAELEKLNGEGARTGVQRRVAYSTREIEELIDDAKRDEREKFIAVTKTLEKKLGDKAAELENLNGEVIPKLKDRAAEAEYTANRTELLLRRDIK